HGQFVTSPNTATETPMNAVNFKSNRNRAALYTLLTACVAVGACAAAQAGEARAGTQPAASANTITVSYRDLNLATREGASALYARINHAARAVCVGGDLRELGALAEAKACQRQAVAQAVHTVHSEQLA